MTFTDPFIIQSEIDYRRELAMASKRQPRARRKHRQLPWRSPDATR